MSSTAGEHKRMDPVIIDDRQLEITLKRGCKNRLPFHELLLQIIEASSLIEIISGDRFSGEHGLFEHDFFSGKFHIRCDHDAE